LGGAPDLVDESVERLDRRAFAPVLDALGQQGSVGLLPTPALICDVAALDANIGRLQTLIDAAGLSLRPHAKSHKNRYIAHRQLLAGAVGICCAKVAEAEAMFETRAWRGDVEVLVTSPVASPAVADRVAELARTARVIAAVDDLGALEDLAGALSRSGASIGVVCDVDVGLARTGVTSADGALQIAARSSELAPLRFLGLQGYAGHAQHVAPRSERARAVSDAAGVLAATREALEHAGYACSIVTGGGTGSWMVDAADGVLSEIQAGSYVFMDREYRDALAGDPEDCFAQSLFVLTTVISANQRDFVTVDAGLKAMATDAGPAAVADGAGTYAFFGDEQGLVTRSDESVLARGTRLRLVPPHCDPTVNLYDHLWLVDGDRVVGLSGVVARGRSY
jgi:D-serine deaminase-like pyridoxal phosphate-dependent protein